jgi:hypothetical protein
MKCISIRQPWAWLIVRPDLTGYARAAALLAGVIKTIENRTWPTRYRGPVLLHASKGMTRAEYEDACAMAFWAGVHAADIPKLEDLQRGGIVGKATLADCIPSEKRASDWHMGGQFGFLLQDIEPLPFTPLKGALGLFDVTWPQEGGAA